MKIAHKVLIGSIIAALLIFGFSTDTVHAQNDQVDGKSDEYKNLLEAIDGSIRSLRLHGEKRAKTALERAQSEYNSLISPFEDNNFGNNPNLAELDQEIDDTFQSLQQSPEKENIRNLRNQVEELASGLGINLPFYYEHAILIILGISLVLSFIINWINRVTVDWEMVNAAKAKMNEWQSEFREAQRKGNKKKVKKLKLRQDELMNEQKTVMGATMKPMLYYIIPFMLLWWYLNSVYSGWVVAWVPFTFPWPNLGFLFFTGPFVSLGFLGWYLISYFGFAQVFRKFLVPG